jgi:hypothetical protein
MAAHGSGFCGASSGIAGYAATRRLFNPLKAPFKGESFKVWQSQMRIALHCAGLAPWVFDGKERPAESGPEQELWDMRDAEAMSALIYNVGDEYQGILMSCKTSREMWLHLSYKFQRSQPQQGPPQFAHGQSSGGYRIGVVETVISMVTQESFVRRLECLGNKVIRVVIPWNREPRTSFVVIRLQVSSQADDANR